MYLNVLSLYIIQYLLLIMNQGEIQALTLTLDVINNNAIISNIVQVVAIWQFLFIPNNTLCSCTVFMYLG
jgi:hypothetical protein